MAVCQTSHKLVEALLPPPPHTHTLRPTSFSMLHLAIKSGTRMTLYGDQPLAFSTSRVHPPPPTPTPRDRNQAAL